MRDSLSLAVEGGYLVLTFMAAGPIVEVAGSKLPG